MTDDQLPKEIVPGKGEDASPDTTPLSAIAATLKQCRGDDPSADITEQASDALDQARLHGLNIEPQSPRDALIFAALPSSPLSHHSNLPEF